MHTYYAYSSYSIGIEINAGVNLTLIALIEFDLKCEMNIGFDYSVYLDFIFISL